MDFNLIIVSILGYLLIVLAFIGCIIPALPGPPLAFLSLLIAKLFIHDSFTSGFLVTFGLITAGVYLLDYILPVFGARAFRATKYGIWGSILGMFIGMFFFPPFGMILGMLFGAIIGELIAGKAKSEAIKIGIVSFIFSLIAILIKIILVGVITFYFSEFIFNSLF